jgi:hypothetical protein
LPARTRPLAAFPLAEIPAGRKLSRRAERIAFVE